jgi:hypothetical protein
VHASIAANNNFLAIIIKEYSEASYFIEVAFLFTSIINYATDVVKM